MPWFYAVTEAEHDVQNPTSPEKIRLLGERLRLTPDSRVLDIASGQGGPAVLLAESFGCQVTCVEQAEEFDAVARRRVHEAGLDSKVRLVHADARQFPLDEARYDAALCLGASWIWGNLSGTLTALAPAVRGGGFVSIGEPYWRVWPLPETDDIDADWREEYLSLPATVERFETAGLVPVSVIDSSLDDWDRYESLHWLAAEEWLDEHPDDPDAGEIRTRITQDRERYFRWQRDLLSWAIIVGRKR
jgi:SAM-dependent methyltransferase